MPRRSAAAILSVPMSKPRYTAVESQLMISPSKRSAIASASALLPVAVGPRTATALALFKVAHGHAAFVSANECRGAPLSGCPRRGRELPHRRADDDVDRECGGEDQEPELLAAGHRGGVSL